MPGIEFSRLKVLLAEDEAFTRHAIRVMLQQLGVGKVTEVANGRDALLELADAVPDIFFCDLHMRPIEGHEVVAQIRASPKPEIARLPVVVVTSDCSKTAVITAKKLTVAGYLVKPVNLLQLRGRIEAVIAADPDLAERLTAP